MKMISMEKIIEAQVNMVEIADALRSGQTLIYPTETCYGLGCDASNSDAVEKIFAIKGRDKQKPCIVLFKDIDTVKKYAVLDPAVEEKILPHWPGSLTVVLPVQPNTNLSSLVISSEGKIACRISPHPFIQNLLHVFDGPLVSTSANFAGAPNIYTSEEIVEVFTEKNSSPNIFVDAGSLPPTPPSTIIEVEGETVKVLRQGEVIISS